MNGLLVVSFALFVLLQVSMAQGPDCIRIEEGPKPIKLSVNWCSQPVTATLAGPIGYCTNARCRSSHKVHLPTDQVTRGESFVSDWLVHVYIAINM